jgi:ABC-2 type transport system ATP-binding protein
VTQTANGDGSREMIRVEGLHKRYAADRPEAVAGVDFVVDRGQIFGLLGPNGAGKTTTIGTMTTRVKPTAGRVLIDGIDVAKDPVGVKQRIAVVPQMSNLDRTLTAVENLTFHAAYFGAPRRERRKRALELLDRFGLGGRESEKVNKYSGGMAQRLMIARALMHQPKLLVLDEPTTGLDPQSRLFLWERIIELRELGTTLLLTTHDMLEADRLCDRIAIMDHGQVIANDTPRGLRRLLPAEGGLELVLESPEDPVGRFESQAGVERTSSTEIGNGRWQVRLYGADERLPDAALAVTHEPGGPVLAEMRRIEGTLEDVFVHLTGRDLR